MNLLYQLQLKLNVTVFGTFINEVLKDLMITNVKNKYDIIIIAI